MKSQFKVLIVLAAGFMTSAFADSSRLCQNEHNKFLELAQSYSSCNSVIGSDRVSCDRFCDAASGLTRSGGYYPTPAPTQYCGQDQINQARQNGYSQGRDAMRNEIMQDLSIRLDVPSRYFYGINETDCSDRVSQAVERIRVDAVRRCNDQATNFKNCYVHSEKINGSFGKPGRFEASATFKKEDNRSSQSECESTALAQATSQALRECSDTTGSECRILNELTYINHKLKAPSGPRMGRRDERICDARVTAEASRDLTYKCNITIKVRNQAIAN